MVERRLRRTPTWSFLSDRGLSRILGAAGLLLLAGGIFFLLRGPAEEIGLVGFGSAADRIEHYPERLYVDLRAEGQPRPAVTALVALSDGDVVALDAEGGRLLIVHDGEVVEDLPIEPPAAGGPPRFTDAELSDSGTLLLADAANGQIWHYTLEGAFVGPFPTDSEGSTAVGKPTGICKDEAGRIMVADAAAHRVDVYDKLGTLITSFGGSGVSPGRLSFPNDLQVGPDGLVYVADSNNRRVQAFDQTTGKLVRVVSQTDAATGLALPRSLAFDAEGRMHVVDALQERVSVFDPQGEFEFSYGHLGDSPERLSVPEAIVMSGDAVVVGDSGNGRLVFYSEREGSGE